MNNNMIYFFLAYVVVWACLAGYMSSLSRRQKLLHDEIQVLKKRLRIRE
ncbi:hypothetical protein U27_03013 [Candidatus Vecturithrix granuli]|uniref:CcmD family protein n=1 Tax=Vecturithrix granuli TaxID=1499967 RepID=A0A081BUP6_VECG1|nr:hypothetical protein U27_03013 [Candidatus Vecturithrix granuli]